MAQKIIDKAMVFVLSMLLVAHFPLSGGMVVVAVLLVLLLASLSHIMNREWQLIMLGAIPLVLSVFYKEALIALPMVAYAQTEGDTMLFVFEKSSKTNKDILFMVLKSTLVLGMLISALVNNSYETMAIITVAVVLGVRTVYNAYRHSNLIKQFDDARFEAIEASRKRRMDREQEDEKIYMATLEERNRIAREIHDNIGHMITRTIVQMQALKILNKDENLAPQLDSVSDTLNNAMTAVRKSVHELHNESIDLSISINDIVNSVPDRFKVKVNTLIESPVPNDIKAAIIAIVKESVTNIVKYSNGDRVKVEIVENSTFWRVSIEDNGKNKKYEYQGGSIGDGGGIGLSNIVSRTESLGGRARISADESGFKVVCTIPFNK